MIKRMLTWTVVENMAKCVVVGGQPSGFELAMEFFQAPCFILGQFFCGSSSSWPNCAHPHPWIMCQESEDNLCMSWHLPHNESCEAIFHCTSNYFRSKLFFQAGKKAKIFLSQSPDRRDEERLWRAVASSCFVEKWPFFFSIIINANESSTFFAKKTILTKQVKTCRCLEMRIAQFQAH